MSVDFPDPPTAQSLSSARATLHSNVADLDVLDNRIATAEADLAHIVLEAQCAINQLRNQRSLLQDHILHTKSYLSPIRRLPSELLSQVFMWAFEANPSSAWILAAVCRSWRRLALDMPRIWSKIRLVTNQHSSADTIRLWLERSGPSVPLDIVIYLRVAKSDSTPAPRSIRRRSPSPSPAAVYYPSWSAAYHQAMASSSVPSSTALAHYVIPHHAAIPPSHAQLVVPIPSASSAAAMTSISHDMWGSPLPSPPSSSRAKDRSAANATRIATHWGYIAIFYLVEQMRRWERFVFRYDKQFSSLSALKSINGDAPLLREFEVSSTEAVYYQPDWPWLPNISQPPSSSAPSSPLLPQLRHLTLQNAPFKWSSPIFNTGLHTLSLRSLPASHLPLDRLLHILALSAPTLHTLSVHFPTVTQNILPLSPLTLPELKEFSAGGHYLMTQLIDVLTLPVLEELNLDIESRDPIEEGILSLLNRIGPTSSPNSASLKHLSVGYGFGCGRRATRESKENNHPWNLVPKSSSGGSSSSASSMSTLYYGAGGVIMSWTLLNELPQLESLRVGGTPMDSLLNALSQPDEDMLTGAASTSAPGVGVAAGSNGWLCPNLKELGLKQCHPGHSEGVAKLVAMVNARNPAGGSSMRGVVVDGVCPVRLESLEVMESAILGEDVVKWVKGRVDQVDVVESNSERGAMHSFAC